MTMSQYTKQTASVSHVMSNSAGSTVWHLVVSPIANRVRKVKGVKGQFSMNFQTGAAGSVNYARGGYTCWLRLPQQAGVPGVTEYEIDNRRLWVPTPYAVGAGTCLYAPTPYLKAVDVSDQDALWFGVHISLTAGGDDPFFMACFEWAEARELKA